MENLSVLIQETPSNLTLRYLAPIIHKGLSLMLTLAAQAATD